MTPHESGQPLRQRGTPPGSAQTAMAAAAGEAAVKSLILVERYEMALASNPLRTQMLCTGVLFGVGDM